MVGGMQEGWPEALGRAQSAGKPLTKHSAMERTLREEPVPTLAIVLDGTGQITWSL